DGGRLHYRTARAGLLVLAKVDDQDGGWSRTGLRRERLRLQARRAGEQRIGPRLLSQSPAADGSHAGRVRRLLSPSDGPARGGGEGDPDVRDRISEAIDDLHRRGGGDRL